MKHFFIITGSLVTICASDSLVLANNRKTLTVNYPEVKVHTVENVKDKEISDFTLEIKNVPYHFGNTKSVDYANVIIDLFNGKGFFTDKDGGAHSFSLNQDAIKDQWYDLFISMQFHKKSMTVENLSNRKLFEVDSSGNPVKEIKQINFGSRDFQSYLYVLSKNSKPYFSVLNFYNSYMVGSIKNHIGDNIFFSKPLEEIDQKDIPQGYKEPITFIKVKIPYWFYIYDMFLY